MKRCVIVGGADIEDYGYIRRCLEKNDSVVYCDSGLKHLNMLKAEPYLIVGDFDSHEKPESDAETIVLPREKDDTDTVYAVKEMMSRGYDDFLLIGVIGGRIDHTLGNISILLYLEAQGKRGRIIDDHTEMTLVSDEPVYIDDDCIYFSLINITGLARGITITDAKYPLDKAEITSEYQYGVSNEVLPGRRARVSLEEGKLLLIKVRNE